MTTLSRSTSTNAGLLKSTSSRDSGWEYSKTFPSWIDSPEATALDVAEISGHFGLRHIGSQRKENVKARIRRPLQDGVGDLVHAVSSDGLSALSAVGDADPGEQQPKVIVDFRGRSHRRARGPGRIALTDGDCRRDAEHFIDFRSFDAFEELPRIGRQRFDISPLPFRVDRVEGQRGFARAADAGNDGQRVVGDLEVDVLEVVDPNSPNNDALLLSQLSRDNHKPGIILRMFPLCALCVSVVINFFVQSPSHVKKNLLR